MSGICNYMYEMSWNVYIVSISSKNPAFLHGGLKTTSLI